MFPFDNNTSENPSPDSFLKTSSSHFLQNPNPPFISTFPSPFFDEHELPLHQTPLVAPDPIPETSPKSGKRKRKAGKKDRHSKICTAHGIRDRRMRLSLQVARKFFDIQDMLGYDKASATIEWLLTNSKPAIRQLLQEKRKNSNHHFAFETDSSFSFSFSSECEVVSGVAHEVTSSEKNEKKKSQKFKTPPSRNNDSVRESREKARARARRRTREKMMMKRHENGSSFDWPNSVSTLHTDHFLDDQKLGFSIDQQMSLAHANTSSLLLLLSPDRDAGTIEKLLGNSSGSNHSPISDNMMGFIGDWEMLSNATNQLVSTSMPMAGNSNDNSVNTTQNYPFFAQ